MGAEFNEKTQAFLIIRWGRRLIDMFGDRGRETFLFAARVYGENRGRRMAMRAIRDGKPLDLYSYLQYKEWENTANIRACGEANRASSSLCGNTYVKEVSRCPWNLQFAQMRETEIGNLYCQVIDSSIAAGFSRSFTYRVPQNLNQSPDKSVSCQSPDKSVPCQAPDKSVPCQAPDKPVPCLHVVENASIPALPAGIRREYLRPFDYHCADLHFAFRHVVISVFGEEGQEIARQVEQDFRECQGEEMAAQLLSFAATDFGAI